jgi:hypothetical protein
MDQGSCGPNSRQNSIPPRTTWKSNSPRGSDRTVVGHQAVTLFSLWRTYTKSTMNRRTFRCRIHRSSQRSRGLAAMRTLSTAPPVGGKIFLLTAPFIERGLKPATTLLVRILTEIHEKSGLMRPVRVPDTFKKITIRSFNPSRRQGKESAPESGSFPLDPYVAATPIKTKCEGVTRQAGVL